MTNLKHGDRVRLASWAHPYDRTTVAVNTVRGYAAEYREDPEVAYVRARSQNQVTVWTYHGGATLTDSKAWTKHKQEAEAYNLERAVTLSRGDVVMIEGEAYAVVIPQGNVKGPRNSDPIHFVRVQS